MAILGGQPITLTDAESMIEEYLQIQQITQKCITSDAVTKYSHDALKRAGVLIDEEDNKNAFLFDRSLIERFFSGEEKDKLTGESTKADYLLVVIGAHPKDDIVDNINFKAGSLTVITVGCIKDAQNPNILRAINIDKPANEWPPHGKAIKLGRVPIGDHEENKDTDKVFLL